MRIYTNIYIYVHTHTQAHRSLSRNYVHRYIGTFLSLFSIFDLLYADVTSILLKKKNLDDKVLCNAYAQNIYQKL